MTEKVPASNSTPEKYDKDTFLLGGSDAEMYQIEKRLRRAGKDYVSKQLHWGAVVDDYEDEIRQLLEEGRTPVAVELDGADAMLGVIDVDHHNNKSDRPSSLIQVMDRIGRETSLVDEMIAANDAGYIPGMEAKMEEYRPELEKRYGPEKFEKLKQKLIDLIRRKDREMQGVTAEMEHAAEDAIEHAERGPKGLMIVHFPGSTPSPITDRLFASWPDGKQNLCVVCRANEVAKDVYYFGRGDICKALKEHFSGTSSWGGGTGYGKRDEQGFGGATVSAADDVVRFITERL